MDIFRTPLDVLPSKVPADYHHPVLFMGSCFTENIGNWLIKHRFPTCINPFGILYNPISISKALNAIISGRIYKNSDLGFHNGLWFSFDHHGKFSDPNQETCLKNINHSIHQSTNILKKASHLFITWGSAWIYQLKHENRIVGNCHKIPDNSFTRRILSIEEIMADFNALLENLRKFNPELKIVLSLSPVRHIRDGFTANHYSKSVLTVALHKMISEKDGLYYFPAFEMMMDDLRDYRFYADDMLHPGELGIKYITEKFSLAWLSEETRELMKGIEILLKARNHQPLFMESENYRRFIQASYLQAEKLQEKFPFIDLNDDLQYFKKQLN